jgi:hypothetical protein
MEVPNAVIKYFLFTVLGLLVVGVIGGALIKRHYDSEMARLRNEVAVRDETIEIQKGVYSKLALETDDLKSLLNSKDAEIKGLLAQVKKNKEDLLAANQLVVYWKKAYEAKGSGTQTETPGENGVVRKRVDFKKDFGAIGVTGWTITDPAEYSLKVEQLRPLQITLAVSQDASGAWHSYATSNDENSAVDIKLAAVNPYLLEPRWYERIQFNAMLAGGNAGSGFGVLVGAGASYRMKQFDLGPAVFLTISDRIDKYFGATFTWRPFEK